MSKLENIGNSLFSIQAITSAVNSLMAPIAARVTGPKLTALNKKKKQLITKISNSQQLQGLLNDYLNNKSNSAANALMRSSGFGNDMWIAEKEMDEANNNRVKMNTVINKSLDGDYKKLNDINDKISYVASATDPFSAIVRSNKTKI